MGGFRNWLRRWLPDWFLGYFSYFKAVDQQFEVTVEVYATNTMDETPDQVLRLGEVEDTMLDEEGSSQLDQRNWRTFEVNVDPSTTTIHSFLVDAENVLKGRHLRGIETVGLCHKLVYAEEIVYEGKAPTEVTRRLPTDTQDPKLSALLITKCVNIQTDPKPKMVLFTSLNYKKPEPEPECDDNDLM